MVISKMLAENNPYMQEAFDTIYQLTSDETIRGQIEARNAYYARERHHAEIQKAYEEANSKLEALTTANQSLTNEKQALTAENQALRKALSDAGINVPDGI